MNIFYKKQANLILKLILIRSPKTFDITNYNG